jgi:hypothetical protein
LAERIDAALSQSVLSAQIRIHGPVSQGHRIALFFCHLMHLHPLALCRHFVGCFCEGPNAAKSAVIRPARSSHGRRSGRAGGRAGRSVPTGMIIMTRIVRGGQAGLMKYQPEAFGSGRQTMRARPGGAGPARLPCHAWHRELRGKLTLARSDSDSAPGRPGHAEQPAVTPISVFCRGRRRGRLRLMTAADSDGDGT